MDINVDQLWHEMLLVEQDGKLAFTDMCRLCGSSSLNLLSLYGDEGLENDLRSKIDVYLPIQVSESDSLPHKVCSHCASTLVSWHELMLNCVKIDEKLKEILRNVNVQPNGEFEHLDEENVSCLIENEANLNASLVCEGKAKLKNGKVPAAPRTPTDDEVQRSMGAPNNSKEAQQCHNPEWVEYSEWEVIYATGNNTMFHCARCEVPFGSRKELCVHLSRKHSVFVQNCENCAKLFCTRTVNSNVNSRTNIKLPSNFKRSQDDKNVPVLKDDHSYCSGQTVVKKSKEIDMTCDICSSSFCGKQELLQHLRSHEFKVVELKEKSGSTLLKFDRIKVSKLEKYVHCDKCKKNFCSKDSYQRHYRIHTGEKPYTCDVCGKQFRDGGGLRRHLRDVHDRIKSFGCDICGRFFASKATRDDHRRIHTGERPYICHCCGKTFKSKASLFTHSKTHTNHFPFPCSHCTKSFRRRQELLNHTTVHTGEKPHVCEICGKNFRVKAEMLRHKITHSDDKPFVCEICGLSFKQRRYLRNHKKTHLKTIS